MAQCPTGITAISIVPPPISTTQTPSSRYLPSIPNNLMPVRQISVGQLQPTTFNRFDDVFRHIVVTCDRCTFACIRTPESPTGFLIPSDSQSHTLAGSHAAHDAHRATHRFRGMDDVFHIFLRHFFLEIGTIPISFWQLMCLPESANIPKRSDNLPSILPGQWRVVALDHGFEVVHPAFIHTTRRALPTPMILTIPSGRTSPTKAEPSRYQSPVLLPVFCPSP